MFSGLVMYFAHNMWTVSFLEQFTYEVNFTGITW